MQNKSGNKLLAEKIAVILAEGIKVTQEDLHFINATFACHNSTELSRILLDPDSADAQTIYEYLLFPDENVQMQLERDLEKNEYIQDDITEITRMLVQKGMDCTIIFPENRGTISMKIPENALRQFVSRLNISHQVDESIAEMISKCITDSSDYFRTRVKFRNQRFEFVKPVALFMCELIEKTYPDSHNFWDALNFMLDFLNTRKFITDIYSALIGTKQENIRLLELAEKKEKALQENAVETLMMKKDHIPPVNIEEIRKQLYLIDYICLKIYGRSDLS